MHTRLNELTEAGKKKGYVLCDEIDELLPADCEGDPELDAILAALDRAGVPVVATPDRETPDDFGDQDDPLRVYLREVAKVPPLSPDAERALARLRTVAAKRQLVETNLRAVVWIAKRYTNRDYHVLDLIKEGNICLMHAAEVFDPGLGYRFSTYVTWCTRRAILKKLRT